MLMGDIADPDSGDQSVIPRRYQGSDLVDKPLVYRGVVQKAQVDCGEPLGTERLKVVLDTRAELIWVVVGQKCAGSVPTTTDLADQCQVVGVGIKRFPDKLIHDYRPVVPGGVDVVDARVYRSTQHCDGFIVVAGWAEYSRAGQLHGAVSDAPHDFVGETVLVTRCVHSRVSPSLCPDRRVQSRAWRSMCSTDRRWPNRVE